MKSGFEDLISRLHLVLAALERERLLEHGLQPVHARILKYLARANRYSDNPMAVTDFLQITKGSVSQSLLLLQRNGWLKKGHDSEDKRRLHLHLTRKATQLLTELRLDQRIHSKQKEFASLIDETEENLTTILGGLQRQKGFRSFGVCHTCRHFQKRTDGTFQCGLTGERLFKQDSLKICREHERAA